MASIATATNLPALGAPHELVALSLTGMQLHWAVLGPLLRPLHQQLGEVDLVSRDVPVEVGRELEKQQWMLRVQLGERT